MESKAEKNIHRVFILSVFLKGIDALVELAAGVVILFVGGTAIVNFVLGYTEGELSEDPNDLLAQFLSHSAHSFSVSGEYFIAFYLLAHGLVKFLVVIALLQRRYWAYPLSIAVFFAFIFYQIYRYVHTHSPWLIALTVFDLFVVWLVWHEYRYFLKHRTLPT